MLCSSAMEWDSRKYYMDLSVHYATRLFQIELELLGASLIDQLLNAARHSYCCLWRGNKLRKEKGADSWHPSGSATRRHIKECANPRQIARAWPSVVKIRGLPEDPSGATQN